MNYHVLYMKGKLYYIVPNIYLCFLLLPSYVILNLLHSYTNAVFSETDKSFRFQRLRSVKVSMISPGMSIQVSPNSWHNLGSPNGRKLQQFSRSLPLQFPCCASHRTLRNSMAIVDNPPFLCNGFCWSLLND